MTCREQPLHSEGCRWLNAAQVSETDCVNSGRNCECSHFPQSPPCPRPICHYPYFAMHHPNALLWNQPETNAGEQCCPLPSWIPPKTWSLGLTRLCTVFNSSTQPTLCSSFGTQSRKPEGKMQSILLILPVQARFHVVFQEAIVHPEFITLSVVITSPLKRRMAFKKCFTVT